MMANSRFLTVAETISALEHSDLPTVIVEGSDDIIIYRQLENHIVGVDVMPVGGRNAVLEIFQNKLTNPKLQGKEIVFIADQDIWCNIGIPNEFVHPSLIFTSGYSIENDLFIDYECQKMIDNDMTIKVEFEIDKIKFIEWYALALQKTIHHYQSFENTVSAEDVENLTRFPKKRKISTSQEHVLNNFEEFRKLEDGEIYPYDLQSELLKNFPLSIRGKALLSLFTTHIKNGLRIPSIFQNIAVRPGKSINRIFDDVTQQFVE